jgi:hypothetical protein
VLNKVSKNFSRQVTKFVYLPSTSDLSVLNMGYKYFAPTEDIRVMSIDLQSISSTYVFETLLAPSDEVRLVALKENPAYAENCLGT